MLLAHAYAWAPAEYVESRSKGAGFLLILRTDCSPVLTGQTWFVPVSEVFAVLLALQMREVVQFPLMWEVTILNAVETWEKVAENKADSDSLGIIQHMHVQRERRAFRAHWAGLGTLHQLQQQRNAADSSLPLLSVVWTLVPPSASLQEGNSPAW